jgi:hypothetical protein
MMTPLLVAGSGILCVSAVIAFVLTRRYNARFAMLMPLMGLILAVGVMWQSDAGDGGVQLVLWALVTSSPILLGCVIGILLARRKPE